MKKAARKASGKTGVNRSGLAYRAYQIEGLSMTSPDIKIPEIVDERRINRLPKEELEKV